MDIPNLDHAHDLINIAVAREAINALQTYIQTRGRPDPKNVEVARIAAADTCKSAGAYLSGDLVILSRQDAIEMKKAYNEHPGLKARVDSLTKMIDGMKAKKPQKKKRPTT